MSAALRIRALEPGDRARWDAYVRAQPGSHFGQLVAWKDVVEGTYGCRAHYWLAEEEGRVRGVLPLFEKRGRTAALFSGLSFFAESPARGYTAAGALIESLVARALPDPTRALTTLYATGSLEEALGSKEASSGMSPPSSSSLTTITLSAASAR